MYIDTSVAVKLYTREPDSAACEDVVGDADLVSSELLHCELRSALSAKERAGLVSESQREAVWSAFERDLVEKWLYLVPFNNLVVRDASELIEKLYPDSPLRTLDALHLATYLSVDAGPLFTKDKRMLAAARRLQLPLAG
jgi:predicted nucleic acid-binding protein